MKCRILHLLRLVIPARFSTFKISEFSLRNLPFLGQNRSKIPVLVHFLGRSGAISVTKQEFVSRTQAQLRLR